MTPDVKPLIAGNWKMNGDGQSLAVISAIATGAQTLSAISAALCVPATLIDRATRHSQGGTLMIGGQDCHSQIAGAHTGDLSAAMLRDAGAQAVIVGHSERRADHGESDGHIADKARAAHREGLLAIICVGETRQEREEGAAQEVVLEQLATSVTDRATAQNTVIAYEPVWAIGTGLTASTADIAAIHAVIRGVLCVRFDDGAGFRILYGGSMKPDNAADILSVQNVDGGLIGGASLKSDDFLAICEAAQTAATS